jgi:hypothetical protein
MVYTSALNKIVNYIMETFQMRVLPNLKPEFDRYRILSLLKLLHSVLLIPSVVEPDWWFSFDGSNTIHKVSVS